MLEQHVTNISVTLSKCKHLNIDITVDQIKYEYFRNVVYYSEICILCKQITNSL